MFIIKNFFYIFRKSILVNVFNKLNYIKKYNNISKLKINIYTFLKNLLVSEVILKKERPLVHENRNFYEKNYTLYINKP